MPNIYSKQGNKQWPFVKLYDNFEPLRNNPT